MKFQASSLDDALNDIMRRLLRSGSKIRANKGAALEFTGVLVELTNPLARFSRSEDRSTLFSYLGETLWYISSSDRLSHIEYYIPNYRKFINALPEQEHAPGAYGPRLFGGGDNSQITRLIESMKKKRGISDTRQAVAQIFSHTDLISSNGDVPCTTTIQFLPRKDKLHVVTTMRSNDVYRGFPHDVFAFTFIQEIVARALSLEVGTYSHFVGSLHLYDENVERARDYLAEGWQLPIAMPAMPAGDPKTGLKWLLEAEQSIRLSGVMPDTSSADPYWADLARVLLIKVALRDKHMRTVAKLKNQMESDVYAAFIRSRERATLGRPVLQLEIPGISSRTIESKQKKRDGIEYPE